jgi:hypothetical protein
MASATSNEFPEEDDYTLNKLQDEALERATCTLGEFYDTYAIVVLDSEGILGYQVSSYYEGKMLCSEAIVEMNKDYVDVEEEEEE